MSDEIIDFSEISSQTHSAVSEFVSTLSHEPVSSISGIIIGASLKSLAEHIFKKTNNKNSKIIRFICNFFGAKTNEIIGIDILNRLKDEKGFAEEVKKILKWF